MALVNHPNVYNTCLRLLRKRGFLLQVTGELDDDGSYPLEMRWIAEKDGFRFVADNPIELFGLVAIHDCIKPEVDEPYWWHVDGPDIEDELKEAGLCKKVVHVLDKVSLWNGGDCPMDSGLYLPAEDAFLSIRGSAMKGYALDAPVALATHLAGQEWTSTDASCQCESEEVTVIAGGGCWEGEGFVAAAKADTLLWLWHFDDSEPFALVMINDGVVIAVAEHYLAVNTYHIPIDKPQAFSVSVRAII